MTTKKEFATEDIIAKLTQDEYEWFATHEYLIGVGVGRRQMHETIMAFLKKYAGDLFGVENDELADAIRDLRKMLMKEIQI